MKEYAVIYEQGETNWGAMVPDLPGCISIGDTFEAVQENIYDIKYRMGLDFLEDSDD